MTPGEGPRRHLRRGPFPNPNPQRPSSHGQHPQPRHQPHQTQRRHQHRRSPQTPRQRHQQPHHTGPEQLKHHQQPRMPGPWDGPAGAGSSRAVARLAGRGRTGCPQSSRSARTPDGQVAAVTVEPGTAVSRDCGEPRPRWPGPPDLAGDGATPRWARRVGRCTCTACTPFSHGPSTIPAIAFDGRPQAIDHDLSTLRRVRFHSRHTP